MVASAAIGTFLVVDVLVHLGVFGASYQASRSTTWESILLIGAVPLELALLTGAITRRRLLAFALLTVLAPVVGLVLVFLLPQIVLTALVMITLPISPDHEGLLDWAVTSCGSCLARCSARWR